MATSLDPSPSSQAPSPADTPPPLSTPSTSDPSQATLPTFGLSPSPLLTSLHSLVSCISLLDSERSSLLLQRSALLERVASLEATTVQQQRDLAELRHKVEVLEYGVRHERALRMGGLIARRGWDAASLHRGEEKQAGAEGDEKEQMMLQQGKPAAGKRGRGKGAVLMPQYFTLPSQLPAVPVSPSALLKWRAYIQGEGANTRIDVLSHEQREAKLPSSSPPRPPPPPAQAENADSEPLPVPASPGVVPASPSSGGEGKAVTGILSGGRRGPKGLKAKKKIQFKDVSSDEEEEEQRSGKGRKAVTHATFVPPSAASDDAEPSFVSASPSSSSSATASSAASTSTSSSLSALSLRAVSASKPVKMKLALRFHTAAVRALAFSSSPSASSSSSILLATASEDSTVHLFALPSSTASSSISVKKPKPLEPLGTFRHLSAVLTVALHQASGVCVAGTAGGEVDVWSLEGPMRGDGLYGDVSDSRMGRKGGWTWGRPVWSVAINEQGSVMAAACADGCVYLLDALQLSSAPLHALPSPGGESSLPSSVCFLPTGELVAGYTNGDVLLIDAATGAIKCRIATSAYVTSVSAGPAPTPPSAAAVSLRFVSGHADGSVRLLDGGAEGGVVCVAQAHADAVTSVSYSAGDGRVASCGHDEMVRLWEVQTREAGGVGLRAVQVLEPHATHRLILGEAIHCVRWERGLLASAGADGVIKIFA